MGKADCICLKENEKNQLKQWWTALADDRGARARLRRAEKPDDVLLTEPFFQFLRQMPARWANPDDLLSSALVAAALSHVKENVAGQRFARQLASSNGDKPRMSELRFQQLQKSRDPEEFFRRLLRAIRMMGGKVNICSLADSILHWMKEYRYGAGREPSKRLAVRWANDYYTASSTTENQA